MDGRGRLGFPVLLLAAAIMTAACSLGSRPEPLGTPAASNVPVDAQPYPVDEPVRAVRLDSAGGSGGTVIVDLIPAATSEHSIVRQQIAGSGSRATRVTVEGRDGTRGTIDIAADGLPTRLTDPSGATVILDWSQWSSGVLRYRSGANAAQAEARAPATMTLTAQQRSTIDGLVRRARTARLAGQHPIAFTAEDASTRSIPLPLVTRDITLTDTSGRNVSGIARVASVQCTPPVVCRWQGGATARAVQVNITMEAPTRVPRDEAWTRERSACEAQQSQRGNWLEHATTIGGILAALVLPESRVIALFAASQGPQVGKSINLLRDCDRIADYAQGTRLLAAAPVKTRLKFCLATSDRPPLVQCHDEEITASPTGSTNHRAFTMRLEGTSGAADGASAAQNVAPKAPAPVTPVQPQAPAPQQPAPANPPATKQPAPAAPAPATPVRLTGVSGPASVKGGTAGDTTVTWTGTLKPPARIAWVPFVGPGGCSNSAPFDCGFSSWDIPAGFTGNSFTMKGGPSCPRVTAKWTVAWDISIVDGNGRSNAVRLTSACAP